MFGIYSFDFVWWIWVQDSFANRTALKEKHENYGLKLYPHKTKKTNKQINKYIYI